MLDADATVAGYWSDGTADVELTVSLRNEGGLKFDDTQSITVTCNHDAEMVDGCGGELHVSLHDGYGPVSETLHPRVPMGEMTFRLDYGNGEPLTIPLDVPERILGVDRDVWECFSDTSNRGTYWEFDEGIGCAAWASEKLAKWDQDGPVKVRVTGIDSWIEVFKRVLVDVGRLVNLDFEWVASGSEPEEGIIADIGVPHVIGGDIDETCRGGVPGCADVKIRREREIYKSNILIHTIDGRGSEFDDLSAWEQSRVLGTMIHESIHALSWMQHRTEPVSIMKGHNPRATLSPMDEALLRLYGHPLVRPGMTISEIEPLIVFNDELSDPQPDLRFAKWNLVMKAYNTLREAGAAHFRVRATLPDCGQGYGWADYRTGNLTRTHGGFSWIGIDDGRNQFYTIYPVYEAIEHWRQSPTGWEQVPADEYANATQGWRSNLADLHILLRRILYYADWTAATLSARPDGLATLSFIPELGLDGPGSWVRTSEIVMVIHPKTFAIHEYDVTWTMTDQACGIYRVEATDGRFETDFQFPAAVHEGSAALNVCDVALGTISGTIQRFELWQRHCGATWPDG